MGSSDSHSSRPEALYPRTRGGLFRIGARISTVFFLPYISLIPASWHSWSGAGEQRSLRC